jgi:hypothetical protein
MDPTSIAMAALNFAGAAVATHIADEAIAPLWKRAKAAIQGTLGREPKPGDFDSRSNLLVESEVMTEALRFCASSPLLRRVDMVRPVFKGARILWVDDQPKWNTYEAAFLRSLSAEIDQVLTSAEALARFQTGSYDLAISDMARDGNSRAGVELLIPLSQRPPVVFYVLELDAGPPPAGSLGITNRPDELFHFVMDGLERRRA